MAIVSSVYAATDSGGVRRRVVERHTDHVGQQYTNEYWTSSSSNIDSLLSDHAALLSEQLALSEINEVLS